MMSLRSPPGSIGARRAGRGCVRRELRAYHLLVELADAGLRNRADEVHAIGHRIARHDALAREAGDVIADRSGRIRIYIPRDKLKSKAAMMVVKTTRENVETEKVTTSTQQTPVMEARPDFYFRVTRADGTIVDTLQLGAGFFKNFLSSRIGTPANPMTITIGGSGPIVIDPGVVA